MVRMNLPSGTLELDEAVVEQLRAAAAEMAGRSTAARDLSLVLDRALLSSRTVALRRAEVQTLIEVADSASLTELRERPT
jgi:hypothetical protein